MVKPTKEAKAQQKKKNGFKKRTNERKKERKNNKQIHFDQAKRQR